MPDRHEAALRAALAERDRLFDRGGSYLPARELRQCVEAALAAADAHDGAVLCSDGSPVHDFKGQPICPGCGWGGIFDAEAGRG